MIEGLSKKAYGLVEERLEDESEMCLGAFL